MGRVLVAAGTAAGLVLGGGGLAAASPAAVDNVVGVIGANVAAGKWGLAEKNIEALGATIRNELMVNKTPVSVGSNPVQVRLDAVNQRLQMIKDDYKVLYDARTRINKASVKQAKLLIAQIRLELVQKLNLINARGAMDALDAMDTDGAEEIAGTAQRLQTQDRAVKYLSRLINDLRPAMRESQNDRTHLVALNRKFGKVLATYGLTAGGPAVAPTGGTSGTSAHPKVSGRWTEGPGGCPGAVISVTQDAGGNVTGITDDASAPCNGIWVGSNFRWIDAVTLAFDFRITKDPGNWGGGPGTYRVTFSPDGRSASAFVTLANGQSGTIPWVRP